MKYLQEFFRVNINNEHIYEVISLWIDNYLYNEILEQVCIDNINIIMIIINQIAIKLLGGIFDKLEKVSSIDNNDKFTQQFHNISLSLKYGVTGDIALRLLKLDIKDRLLIKKINNHFIRMNLNVDTDLKSIVIKLLQENYFESYEIELLRKFIR